MLDLVREVLAEVVVQEQVVAEQQIKAMLAVPLVQELLAVAVALDKLVLLVAVLVVLEATALQLLFQEVL
jgi:hypothetical protein